MTVRCHGEMLGDHDIYRKAVPYEGPARVPRIISDAPARSQGGAAPRVSSALSELRDVAPTLLEFAGIPVPESMDGRSLVGVIGDAEAGSAHREWLRGEHLYWGQSLRWATNSRYRCIWGSGEGIEQLFDLVDDPGETHDLVAAGARGILECCRGVNPCRPRT